MQCWLRLNVVIQQLLEMRCEPMKRPVRPWEKDRVWARMAPLKAGNAVALEGGSIRRCHHGARKNDDRRVDMRARHGRE